MGVTFMIMDCQISPHFPIITISRDKTLPILLLWEYRIEYTVLSGRTLSVFYAKKLLSFHVMAQSGHQHSTD